MADSKSLILTKYFNLNIVLIGVRLLGDVTSSHSVTQTVAIKKFELGSTSGAAEVAEILGTGTTKPPQQEHSLIKKKGRETLC